LILSDDPSDCDRLHIDSVPVMVTVCKIGECCIVDPSIEEEICSTASVVIGVSGGKVTLMKTVSGGSLHPDTLDNCIDLALSTARSLDIKLISALKMEEEQSENTKATSSFLN